MLNLFIFGIFPENNQFRIFTFQFFQFFDEFVYFWTFPGKFRGFSFQFLMITIRNQNQHQVLEKLIITSRYESVNESQRVSEIKTKKSK